MSLKLLLILGLMFNLSVNEAPVFYESFESTINDQPLYINCLILDMDYEEIRVKNALSKEVIYGHEETSKMASRNNANAAVNGTFFDNFGHHMGGMMMEGEWITLPEPTQPAVIITEENKVYIDNISVAAYLEFDDKQYPINGMNCYAYGKELLLFTDIHGSTTRIYMDAVNYIIEDGIVLDVVQSDQPVTIKEGQKVLVDIGGVRALSLSIGDKVNITFKGSDQLAIYELFQASSFLVKDSENVAKTSDPIIGLMTNREPRTLLGVTDNNKLILLVVDGRIPGVSVGLTGYESAQLMLELGCTDAVILDGGASSTMVVDGQIVNHLANEKERIVGHSIIIQLDENADIKN